MKKIESIKLCPHCCNQALQKVVFQHRYVISYLTDKENDKEIPFDEENNFIVLCSTCQQLSLYIDDQYTKDGNPRYGTEDSFIKSKLLWPTVFKFDSLAIPQKVLDIYSEAYTIKNVSPNSFVVQIRRALEAVCIDQGIKGRTLHDSLEELTQNNKLPPLLSEVTNIIKIIGNTGAHASGPSINQDHVMAIDDFFKVILEYLYIAPYKLEKFKGEVSKFK